MRFSRFQPGNDVILNGNVRGRKQFGKVFSHVAVLGGTFEIAKHLGGELTCSVDTTTFRVNAEAFGNAFAEVDSVVLLAVHVDSHSWFCTWESI